MSRTFSHIYIYNCRMSKAQENCSWFIVKGISITKDTHKALFQNRQGSRLSPHWSAVCTCRVAQTSCRIMQTPQFQFSTLLERDTTYKQAEGRWTAADQIVTVNVRLEIRI